MILLFFEIYFIGFFGKFDYYFNKLFYFFDKLFIFFSLGNQVFQSIPMKITIIHRHYNFLLIKIKSSTSYLFHKIFYLYNKNFYLVHKVSYLYIKKDIFIYLIFFFLSLGNQVFQSIPMKITIIHRQRMKKNSCQGNLSKITII